MESKKPKGLDWLQKLRFNSWELEILLVGFVLVVLLVIIFELYNQSKYFNKETIKSS